MSLLLNKLTSKKLQSDKASIEVTVDEILIVLGTSQANMSNYDDFDWNNDPAGTYISIEEERRRLPKKKKAKKSEEEKKQQTKELPPTTAASSPESIKMVIEMFMNLISINVNKIHIRFEDDVYAFPKQGPYGFGITLNSLNINSTNKEIEFRGPLDMNYEEVLPRDNKNLFLKHILLQDICIYWNSNEMPYVPYRVEEKNKDKDQWIFDYAAFEPEEFRVKMIQPFKGMKEYMKKGELSRVINEDPEYHYLIHPFSIDINMSYYRLEDKDVKTHPHPRFQLTALVSSIILAFKPHIIDDLRTFMEYFQYQAMIPFLKRYLPRRRPLTTHLHSTNPGIKRVRRQIIKDWFSYVIWANRLKKVMRNDICPEFFEEEIEGHRDKYERALIRLKNPRDNELLDRHLLLDRGHDFHHLNEMVAPVIDEIYERKAKDQEKMNTEFYKNFLQKFFIVLKIQSVVIELSEGSKSISYRGYDMPSMQIVIGRIRFGIKIELQKLHLQLLLEDIKVFDSLVLKIRKGQGGATTINETFQVKSGFFLDDEVGDFFRRHEVDDSIFQNRDVQNTKFSMMNQDRTLNDRSGIMLNEKPRLHHYRRKGVEDEYNEYMKHFARPEELIQFSDKTHEQEFQKQEQSRFNFENFWKKKIGKLIGKSDDHDESRQRIAMERADLQSHNKVYEEDDGRSVVERCFILAEGDPVFIALNMSYNMFALPTERKAINLNLDIHNFRIEYSNDIIKTLAETMFSYRRMSDLGLVVIASGPEAFQRKIELWTPWYLVKQAFWIPEFDPHQNRSTISKKQIDAENKEVASMNAQRSIKNNQKAIANIDRNLRNIDMKIKILIKGLFLSLNANYDHKRYLKNRNLLQIKTEPFDIILIKHGEKFGLSVLGIQMMTQSSFELLFQFIQQMQKALSIYMDHPAFKDGKKFYEDIVHNRVVESNRKNGTMAFSRLDASTIRHTGVGHNFSMSDMPRVSQWGSMRRAGDGTFALSSIGLKNTAVLDKPRNRPDVDFSKIHGVSYRGPAMTSRKEELKISPIKGEVINSAPRQRHYDQNDSFDDEASFNDTDEDLDGARVKVKTSAGKSGQKAKLKVGKNKDPSFEPYQEVVREQEPIMVKRPVIETQKLSSTQPRTGPSRLNRDGTAQLRRHVSYFHTNRKYRDRQKSHSRR